MNRQRIILIPAYEPGDSLSHLVSQANQAGFKIIVVNDGSSSQCRNVFEQVSVCATVLTHEQNLGKGCALKTGFSFILQHYPKDCIVVTLDADGQHTIHDALRLCEESLRMPDALILGSRRLDAAVPFRSRFGNTVTRFVYRLSTGLKIYDTQTGLRACGGSLLPTLLLIPGERYEYEMNVLLECSRQQIPIAELEVETIYIDDNKNSHFDAVKDSFKIYREIVKFSASSFVGFIIDYGLYSLFSALTSGMPSVTSLRISNVGARIISASVNYTINRKVVFRSKVGIAKSAASYFALAAAILIGNTALLGFLVNTISMNRFVAKLVSETIFFIVSWAVQRMLIFRKKHP